MKDGEKGRKGSGEGERNRALNNNVTKKKKKKLC